MVRKALESMYKDTCEVIARKKIIDPVTNRASYETVSVLSNQPCRLSFASIPTTTDGNAAEMAQSVKLFLSPDVSVAPGSKIIVTQSNGIVTEYSNSGKPAVHTNHQEINLELFERWS